MRFIRSYNYTNSAWISILENELNNSRPIYYGGTDNIEGHAFVLDGYYNESDNTYFHTNYG
jgi:hypothetical protein